MATDSASEIGTFSVSWVIGTCLAAASAAGPTAGARQSRELGL
jgi:hypothetical protein